MVHSFMESGLNGSSSLEVSNPFNNKIISKVSSASIEDIIEAVHSCHLGFKSWSKYSSKDRSEILKDFYNLVKKNKKRFQKL